jgi:hypothetical protein
MMDRLTPRLQLTPSPLKEVVHIRLIEYLQNEEDALVSIRCLPLYSILRETGQQQNGEVSSALGRRKSGVTYFKSTFFRRKT